jgi:hypothetical protein
MKAQYQKLWIRKNKIGIRLVEFQIYHFVALKLAINK